MNNVFLTQELEEACRLASACGEPSVSGMAKCRFCGCAALHLTPCLLCGTVAYCSTEHQQFDWKRHKPICRTLASQGASGSGVSDQPALATTAFINTVEPAAPTFVPNDMSSNVALASVLQQIIAAGQAGAESATALAAVFQHPLIQHNPELQQQLLNNTSLFQLPSTSTASIPPVPLQLSTMASGLNTATAWSHVPIAAAQAPPPPQQQPPPLVLWPLGLSLTSTPAQLVALSQLNATVAPVDAAPTLASALQAATPCLPSTSSLTRPPSLPPQQPTTSTTPTPIATATPPPTSTFNGLPPRGSALSPPLEQTGGSAARTVNDLQIVDTDDQDIQIIDVVDKGNSKRRKRPTDSMRPALKDHSKNLVYQVTLQEHQKYLMDRKLVVNIHQAMVLRLRYVAEHVIRMLNEYGWAVVDNFLGPEHCKYSYMEMETLFSRGLFSAGQLVTDKEKDEYHVKDIRSDQIYWFDGTDKNAADASTIRLLISMIDSVVQHFKKRIPPYEIGGRSRAMIAIYPGNGTRYVKHVDNPVKDGRCITTIYYCNENWDQNKDGGNLRLYPDTSLYPMDIDPRADRLVFFWSDRRNPHEVLPVYRHRFALTIWYMDKTERSRALARMNDEASTSGQVPEQCSETPEKQPRSPLPSTSTSGMANNRNFRRPSAELAKSNISRPDSRGGNIRRITSLQSLSEQFVEQKPRVPKCESDEDEDDVKPPPRPRSLNPEYTI